jgi:hypothetical protein
VVSDIDSNNAGKVSEKIQGMGKESIFCNMDVTDEEEVRRLSIGIIYQKKANNFQAKQV